LLLENIIQLLLQYFSLINTSVYTLAKTILVVCNSLLLSRVASQKIKTCLKKANSNWAELGVPSNPMQPQHPTSLAPKL